MHSMKHIFFDLDGTLVGDVLPLIVEWDLITRFEKGKIQQFRKNVIAQLQNGLLRPHLATFIDTMKARYENECKFYIYTASESKWAHFLIGCIETYIGFKFERPLFTRKHCITSSREYQKSLHKVAAIILTKKGNVKEFVSNSVLIDNNKILVDSRNLVLCPTYAFKDVYDVLRLISESVVHDNYIAIAQVLMEHGFFPQIDAPKTYSYHVFKSLYFTHLGSEIKENIKNLKLIKDDYWLKLKL
jgi:hypothetical protein